MAYRAGFVAVALALAGVTSSTPSDALADERSEARAVRAERAAGDALLDDAQTAALFTALNLGAPARSDATFSAPTSPECADFQAALDFATTSSAFAGIRDEGGYGALVQTVYAFRRAADAGTFESLLRGADLDGCSRATAPAAPVGGSATFDLVELSGKDLQQLSDGDAPFLGTSARLVLTPPGAAPQTTIFVTLWLHDDRLVTRIALQFDAASGFNLDAGGALTAAIAAPVGALVDAAAVDLAAAGGLSVGSGVPASALPWEARGPCDARTNALVYGTLLTQRRNGTLAPGLADRWTVSDDGLTYTFTIADDVKWSDGTAVTADDMVFALAQYRANRAIAPEFETVSSVTAVGDHTVKVTFTQPVAATGLWALTGAAGVPAKQSPNLSGLPASAGVFAYWEYDPAVDGVIETWDDAIRVAKAIKLRQVATGTGLTALQDRTVDVAAMPASQIDEAKAAGFRVTTAPTGSGAAMFFNYRANPTFSDPQVRQAFSYAINRDELLEGSPRRARHRDQCPARSRLGLRRARFTPARVRPGGGEGIPRASGVPPRRGARCARLRRHRGSGHAGDRLAAPAGLRRARCERGRATRVGSRAQRRHQ